MPCQSANLSNDMKIMMGFFTTYFDGMKAEFMQQFESLEKSLISSLDQRISEAVGAAVKQEIGTVKADFDKKWTDVAKRLDNMEGEWRNYKQTVENKIANLTKQQQNDDGVDKTVTLVICNLPEEAGEAVVDKVNVLIKDGVELEDVKVESAERKNSYRDNIPGVVIATCKSQDD